MKKVYGHSFAEKCVTTYSCGEFTYRADPDFYRPPEGMTFTAIAGGCCDKEDNIFLFSRDMKRPIVMLDPKGRYIKDFGAGMFSNSHFLTSTPDDTLLCVDMNDHVVRELDKDGNLIRDFGTKGVPSDSGFDMNYWDRQRRAGFYPAEYGIIGPWKFWDALKTIKRAAPPFNSPTDVAINSRGEYFFSDGYRNAAVHRFSSEGIYEKTWGGPGCEPGKFFCPHSITIDSEDRVFVGDREADSIHVFDREGNLLAWFGEDMGQPSGLWSDDNYVYSIGRAGYLVIIDKNLEIVAKLGCFNSDLRAHDLCGNSKGELFLFPTYANIDHQITKLTRI